MAKILNITDGTPISLINASGFNLLKAGAWKPATPTSHNKLDERVKETIKLKLTGTSTDNLAAQEQALRNLLRKAFNYDNTTWQQTPVYMTYKGDNETGTRYALIFDGKLKDAVSIIDKTADSQNEFMDMTLELTREAGWRNAVPGAYPSALELIATSGPADPTRVHVANQRDVSAGALTHLYDYDDSAGTFSANHSGSSSFTYFAQGGDDPAVDDTFYWGSTAGVFHNVVMNWTFGDWTESGGAFWYWNGSSWGAVGANLIIYPEATTGAWWNATSGDPQRVFAIGNLTNWATTSVNSVTAYWIKYVLVSVADFVSAPAQTGQSVYSQLKPYISIPATAIDGDLPPFLSLGMRSGVAGATAPTLGTTSKIIMGAKSRGLGDFLSPISFISANMPEDGGGDWTQDLTGSDATEVVDPIGPETASINIPFTASGTSMIERVSISTSDATTAQAFIGSYRVLGRVQQFSGDAGDITSKIRFEISSLSAVAETNTVATSATDSQPEVIDYGTIDIPFGSSTVADTDIDDLSIDFFAARSTGASTMRVYDIALIPIDEWSTSVSVPVLIDNNSASLVKATAEIDSGIVRTRTIKSNADITGGVVPGVPLIDLELQGTYPVLEPSKAYRIYFMQLYYNGAYGTGPFRSQSGSHLVAEVRSHDRYGKLIGAD